MKAITLIKALKNKSEFARSIGVTKQAVNRWITNNNVPSWHLEKVAKVLRVKVSDLF